MISRHYVLPTFYEKIGINTARPLTPGEKEKRIGREPGEARRCAGLEKSRGSEGGGRTGSARPGPGPAGARQTRPGSGSA